MFHVSRANFGRQGDIAPSSGIPAHQKDFDAAFLSKPEDCIDVESPALFEELDTPTAATSNPREQKLLESVAGNIRRLNSTVNALRTHLCTADEIESHLAETDASEQEQCARAVKAHFDDALKILVELSSQREQLGVLADSNKFFAEELRKNSQEDLAKEKDRLVAAEARFIHIVDLVLSGMFY